MINENRFRSLLEQLLAKSKANKVRWTAGDSEEGGELYVVRFPDHAVFNVYYNSPPEAPDFVHASLFISGHFVVGISAERGKFDWELLESIVAEARRCLFHFDEAVDAIEQALQQGDSIGLPCEEVRHDYAPSLVGKWRLAWSGPFNGSEVAEIDPAGCYHTGQFHYRLEVVDFTPGKRITFLKHFGTDRPAERNELEISPDGRVMSGTGRPPDGLKLKYERL